MPQYTPGPWHVGPHYKSDVESQHGRICECGVTRGVQAEANAILIAAAPELLDALKDMDDLMEKLWKAVPWGKTFDLPAQELNEAPLKAKRAIAKAEGLKS